MKSFIVIFTVVSQLSWADSLTELTPKEKAELNQRIERFYKAPKNDPRIMQEPVPEWDMRENRWKPTPNGGESPSRKEMCEKLKLRFPDLYRHHCQFGQWESMRPHDRPENLLKKMEDPGNLVFSLSRLPTQAKVSQALWTDDYWKTQWGGLSYRYADGIKYNDYDEAMTAYAQPLAWRQSAFAPELSKVLDKWSPSEKYDLTVGDPEFTLTLEQRAEGAKLKEAYGKVPRWMGICDGWAAATIMLPAPQKPVTLPGPLGKSITWYASDIKSLASLAWARGSFPTNFIGGRCEEEDPAVHPNGRIQAKECFDNNPATFHLTLLNMVGRLGKSFVMDRTFSHEVWNQPIVSYETLYFNPLNPYQRDPDWKNVAVNYDDTFKAQDRFQSPPTRGDRISQIVGVITTVVYVEEVSPMPYGDVPQEPSLARKTYTYDLELYDEGGDIIPLGGEWHENKHPDFLWVPRPGVVAKLPEDKIPHTFDGNAYPAPEFTVVAKKASTRGAPLCRVIKTLWEKSTGQPIYDCPVPLE